MGGLHVRPSRKLCFLCHFCCFFKEPLFKPFGHFWGLCLGAFGGLLGQVGPLWALLATPGPSWVSLGGSLGPLGASLGALLGGLGRTLKYLMDLWAPLGGQGGQKVHF